MCARSPFFSRCSLLLTIVFAAVGLAQQAPVRSPDAASKPIQVYVSDFELDAQSITEQRLLGGARPETGRPLRSVLRGDSATKARKLVDLMAESLVSDLTKAGFVAQRLSATSVPPSEGLWIRGVFTEVNEGNKVSRAVIGFGSGAVKMNLFVTVTDLARPVQPLYSLAVGNNSGHMPGAAITMNPVAAGAKFALEKNATSKTIKRTAKQIAAQFAKTLAPEAEKADAPAQPTAP